MIKAKKITLKKRKHDKGYYAKITGEDYKVYHIVSQNVKFIKNGLSLKTFDGRLLYFSIRKEYIVNI